MAALWMAIVCMALLPQRDEFTPCQQGEPLAAKRIPFSPANDFAAIANSHVRICDELQLHRKLM
jgi:hypothetical protein